MQRPPPDGVLKIVARGEQSDGAKLPRRSAVPKKRQYFGRPLFGPRTRYPRSVGIYAHCQLIALRPLLFFHSMLEEVDGDSYKFFEGGTATIFVKSGDDNVRVATNVKKDDGFAINRNRS